MLEHYVGFIACTCVCMLVSEWLFSLIVCTHMYTLAVKRSNLVLSVSNTIVYLEVPTQVVAVHNLLRPCKRTGCLITTASPCGLISPRLKLIFFVVAFSPHFFSFLFFIQPNFDEVTFSSGILATAQFPFVSLTLKQQLGCACRQCVHRYLSCSVAG